MVTAITLTLLVVICRFSSAYFLAWNFVPMGAVALYAGARLPRRWAWIVPVAGMVLSDILLDYGKHRPIFELTRWMIYASFAATTLLGPIANRPKIGRWLLPILPVLASTLFFLTSNFGVWAEGIYYPLTLPGLASCYAAGLFFFGRTIVADLLGTGVIFGLGALIERAAQRSASAPYEAQRVS